MAVACLVPPRCGVCAAACGAGEPVCARCAGELRAARPGLAPLPALDRVVWAARYEGSPRALVAALKFGGRLALAELAAEALVATLRRTAGDPVDADGPEPGATVVPVPAFPVRRRMRGFDPAEMIAAGLAARLDLPVSRCLRRLDHHRQVGRPRAARLSDPPRIRVDGRAPLHALLVDDVLTTGATLTVCAIALRAAGGARVEAAVFARSA